MTTARDVIDRTIEETVRQGWSCDVQTDDILNALAAAGFVVVACPPGGRVVVDRTPKPCDCPVMSGEGAWREAHDSECASVVEATTIHGLEPFGDPLDVLQPLLNWDRPLPEDGE